MCIAAGMGAFIATTHRAHGHLTVEGRQIGKSLGNGVDPAALIREYGATSLAKAPQHEESSRSLRTVLAVSVGVLRALAVALEPFVPALAYELARAVGVSLRPGALSVLSACHALPVGLPLGAPALLAPRLAV